MKKLTAVLAGALLTAASFSSFAATPIDRDQAQSMQSLGSVSVSSIRGSIDDATEQLSQKAAEREEPAIIVLLGLITQATPACGRARQKSIAKFLSVFPSCHFYRPASGRFFCV